MNLGGVKCTLRFDENSPSKAEWYNNKMVWACVIGDQLPNNYAGSVNDDIVGLKHYIILTH